MVREDGPVPLRLNVPVQIVTERGKTSVLNVGALKKWLVKHLVVGLFCFATILLKSAITFCAQARTTDMGNTEPPIKNK
jgi:hypothetical protein